jgi:hypothetical protein
MLFRDKSLQMEFRNNHWVLKDFLAADHCRLQGEENSVFVIAEFQ